MPLYILFRVCPCMLSSQSQGCFCWLERKRRGRPNRTEPNRTDTNQTQGGKTPRNQDNARKQSCRNTWFLFFFLSVLHLIIHGSPQPFPHTSKCCPPTIPSSCPVLTMPLIRFALLGSMSLMLSQSSSSCSCASSISSSS